MIKKCFLQNEYIFKKDLHFICNTNIFCVKIYFWNEIYFFTFSFIFFSIKNFFFHIKTFFSANNVYFVKNTNIFSKKKFVFQLSFSTNEQPYVSKYVCKRLSFKWISLHRSINHADHHCLIVLIWLIILISRLSLFHPGLRVGVLAS